MFVYNKVGEITYAYVCFKDVWYIYELQGRTALRWDWANSEQGIIETMNEWITERSANR